MAKADADKLRIFAGRHSKALAQKVCEHLDIPLGDAKTHVFPDGELMVKVEEDVRGRDCYVLLSTCDPVNDNLVELLIFLDCLRRASADRVTVVTPYFGYGRQDRKDEGRVPITAKLVANLITATRCSRATATWPTSRATIRAPETCFRRASPSIRRRATSPASPPPCAAWARSPMPSATIRPPGGTTRTR